MPSSSTLTSASSLAAMPPAGSPLDPSYSHIPRPPPSGRRAGIILHPTSLPGPHGVGDLGPQAFAFVDFLASSGIGAWQVLPLVPPETAFWSPYVGRDALCGSTLLLSPDALVEDGLVSAEDAAEALKALPRSAGRGVGGRRGTKSVDYVAASAAKAPLLLKAAKALVARARNNSSGEDSLATEMNGWRQGHGWVEDSALFDALSSLDPGCSAVEEWWSWPEALRYRHEGAISEARVKYADAIDEFVALQFLFDRQWQALKVRGERERKKERERRERVLRRRRTETKKLKFSTRKKKNEKREHRPTPPRKRSSSSATCPSTSAATPPTSGPTATSSPWPRAAPRSRSPAFPPTPSPTRASSGAPRSTTGPPTSARGSAGGPRRLERARELYDLTRVDHFRAFAGYWSVPGGAETAMEGSWVSGPGRELFEQVAAKIGEVAIIAEDLGVITPDVTEVRKFRVFLTFFPFSERVGESQTKQKAHFLESTLLTLHQSTNSIS